MATEYELLPRTDFVLGIISALKPYAPTVLTGQEAANDETQQAEYPQIVVQFPQKIDSATYRNASSGSYTGRIDFYFTDDQAGSMQDCIDKSEDSLKRLQLTKYPARYIRGSINTSQPISDTSTSQQLWHAYTTFDYEILEKYLKGGIIHG